MKIRSLVVHAALGSTVLGSRNCVELSIPVSVAAINAEYETLRIDSNIDAAEWTRDIDKWNATPLPDRNLGPLAVQGNFTISAQLCIAEGPKAGTLHIATHGFGLNKGYWDIKYQPGNYSYVDAALGAGYSVLTYDRLGAGGSSKPDAYNILQVPLETEVLKELTTLSLTGNLNSASSAPYTAARVVHVGHSYGSAITNHFLHQYGNLSAAALLTGFIIGPRLAQLKVEVGDLQYASEDDAEKWGDRGSGYVVFGTKNAFQLDSLRKQTMDPEILNVWEDTLGDTGAVGQLLSLGVSFGSVIPGFRGPLQMMAGEFDFGYCNGDCNGSFDLEQIKGLYPDAADVSVYLQPETGHCLTMSLNATAGYQEMFDYLGRFNL